MSNLDYHSEHFRTLQAVRVPRVMRVVSWMLLVSFFGVAAFLVFTPWIQTTQGTGAVTALNPNDRVQEINALVPGRKQEWFVRDGREVA
ncbi:MAG: RND transporter, partial [Gammaproteobacteria bacterium]|nr:RND transporter [Gammaproteobacteria bacterium]